MGNLLAYSGLVTKVRAMQSQLISEKQMEEIVRFPSVPAITGYLKKTREYCDELLDLDETLLQRKDLENRIQRSVFQNFTRLYRFSGPTQRKFLDLYGQRYELLVLKELITNIFDHTRSEFPDLLPYEIYFYEHSSLDLKRLAACSTMEELLSALKGNPFYAPLHMIYSRGGASPFDYSMALDLFYFTKIWKVRKKLFSGKELDQITRAFGEEFDLLNLQLIRRTRRYTGIPPASVRDLLIPVHFKLKPLEIKALLESGSPEEADRIFRSTYYGKKSADLPELRPEDLSQKLLRKTITGAARKNPYSISTLYAYLYLKEQEVRKLIIAVECVAYGTPPDTAIQYIRSN